MKVKIIGFAILLFCFSVCSAQESVFRSDEILTDGNEPSAAGSSGLKVGSWASGGDEGSSPASGGPPLMGVNKCSNCNQTFSVTPSGITEYNEHIKVCKKNPMGTRACSICGKKFAISPSGNKVYNEHIKTCGQDADINIQVCSTCGMELGEGTSLAKHKLICGKQPVPGAGSDGSGEVVIIDIPDKDPSLKPVPPIVPDDDKEEENTLVPSSMGIYSDTKMPDYDTANLSPNQLIVRNLYKVHLHRVPTTHELHNNKLVKALNAKTLTENQVKMEVLFCNEKKIVDIYQKYLLRIPDIDERVYWMKKIDSIDKSRQASMITWIESNIKNSAEASKPYSKK